MNHMFDKKIYLQRRDKLRRKLGDGLVLLPGNREAPMNYPDNAYHFRQDSDFSYFFGIDRPELAGLIDCGGDGDMIFGDEPGIDDVIWTGPQPAVKEQALKCGVRKTFPFASLRGHVARAAAKGRKVHFAPPYRGETKILLEELTGIGASGVRDRASLELIRAIVSLREIKEPCEIAELDRAALTGYKMHTAAMRLCRPGVYEREIAGALEGIALSEGGLLSFPVICSQHGETLHNHYHGDKLKAGRLLLVDAGCETDTLYASDNTRTLPVSGKFTGRQKDVYNIVLKALVDTSALVRPGVTYKEVHFKAAGILTEGLKELGLMKGRVQDAVENGAHALFMPHGLGHMMGMDVHDMEGLGQLHVGYDETVRPLEQFGAASLRLGKELKAGFVLTNEPGCYFIPALIAKWRKKNINRDFINFDKVEDYLGFGGIRIEDNLLVTKTGSRILGKAIPRTAEEIESRMAE